VWAAPKLRVVLGLFGIGSGIAVGLRS